MSGASTDELILAIDQGTTNSKAALISADGRVVAGGSAPVGISSPRPEWVEQDADRLWSSVLEAMAGCFESIPDAKIAGIALSTQRESVVGWQASTGMPLGPVIGWQDRRTTAWCPPQSPPRSPVWRSNADVDRSAAEGMLRSDRL